MSSASNSPPSYHLYGGHARYSSWTARVFIILRYYSAQSNPPFTVTYKWLNLGRDKPFPTPSGLVPALTIPLSSFSSGISDTDSTITVNDSAAILETLAELHPDLHLWPKDLVLRAHARMAVAEMHAGFHNLREKCPSNYWGRYPQVWKNYTASEQEAVLKELKRITVIWDNARKLAEEKAQTDEGWLFGEFGIADAMYMPVLWRIRSYDLPVEDIWSDRVKVWVRKMWADERTRLEQHMQEELEDREETDEPMYENLFDGREQVEIGWKCPY